MRSVLPHPSYKLINPTHPPQWSAFDFGFDKNPPADPTPNLTEATQITYNAAALHQLKQQQQKTHQRPSTREEELLAHIAEVEKQRAGLLYMVEKINAEKRALEMLAPTWSATFNDVNRDLPAIPDAPSNVLREALETGRNPVHMLRAARFGLGNLRERYVLQHGEKKRGMETVMATFERDVSAY